jgi:hypothetical protein
MLRRCDHKRHFRHAKLHFSPFERTSSADGDFVDKRQASQHVAVSAESDSSLDVHADRTSL